MVHNNNGKLVSTTEVKFALSGMKRGKAPGDDGITTDLLKEEGSEVHSKIAQLFNQCLEFSGSQTRGRAPPGRREEDARGA